MAGYIDRMNDEVKRRDAIEWGLSAAAGVALTACSGPADAQAPKTTTPNKDATSLLGAAPKHEVVALPFDVVKLAGLSSKLITLHHDKNYTGAVNKLNTIRGKLGASDPSQSGSYWSEYGTLKAGESAARNSALLHELYFGNLVGPGQTPPAALAKALGDRFGSVDAAIEQVRACAKATGGWVVLALDKSSRTIEVVPTSGHAGGAWNPEALLVLDVFEHAYAFDYGPDKGSYLDAFFNNLHWTEIGRRFDAAVG